MEILCPICKEKLSLPQVETGGQQLAYCRKCTTLVHVSYERLVTGTKVWEVRMENHPKRASKKNPIKLEDRVISILTLGFLLFLIWWFYQSCVSLVAQ